MSDSDPSNTSNHSTGARVSLALASLSALSLAPGVATAEILHFTSQSLGFSLEDYPYTGVNVPPMPTNTDWDIDGDGSADFLVSGARTQRNCYYCGGTFRYGQLHLNASDSLSGNAVVASPPQFTTSKRPANLASGSTIGGQLGGSNYWFTPSTNPGIRLLGTSGGGSTAVNFLNFSGAQDQSNELLLGFRFEVDGELHYGWARLRAYFYWWQYADPDGDRAYYKNYVTSPDGYDLEIVEWAYSSNPGLRVEAGSLNEVPLPGAAGLSLLALGAAGLGKWRSNKNKAGSESRIS